MHGPSISLIHAASGGVHSAATAADWSTVVACVLGILLVAAAVVIAYAGRPHRQGGDEDADSGSGGGGGGLRGPDGPRPAGEGPEWWPEFERQFAAYVASEHDTAPACSNAAICQLPQLV